jgi:cytosine/adenosine deaminase-related metal-dependent hydrolase
LGLADVDAGGDELAECATRLGEYAETANLLIVQDGHRADSVLATDRLGLLNDRSLLSHSVDLGALAITALAERGSAVAHNPSAIYSQFGRCPVPELLEAGVTVALGSDATAPDRSSDMFRHMFQATRYHRALNRDPAMLPPGRVLEMATIDAAAALGMQEQLGSIEAGKLADLVVVDGDQPHLTPLIHPVHQVVYYATGADVSAVIVGGDVLMEQRQIVSVDVNEVLETARAEHRLMLAANDLDHLTVDRPGTWGQTRYPDGPGLQI